LSSQITSIASFSFCENRERVTFAARAFRASGGMVADRPLEQRAAQDLAGHGEPIEQLLARGQSSICLILTNETDSRPPVSSFLNKFFRQAGQPTPRQRQD
jgi:hypothetical protein